MAPNSRAKNFTDDEVFTLLQIYEEFLINKRFEGQKTYRAIWQQIADQLAEVGNYQRTGEEIKVKMTNMKSIYASVKKSFQTSSSSPAWKFFQRMAEIVERDPLYEPNVCVYDSVTIEDEIVNNLAENFDVSQRREPSLEKDSSSGPSTSNASQVIEKKVLLKRKRSRPAEANFLKEMVSTDQKLLQMMEKRMKLEENRHEAELKMLAAATDYLTANAALARHQLLTLQKKFVVIKKCPVNNDQ